MIEKLSKNKVLKDSILSQEDNETIFINTGSLVLNLLFSGRLNGGIPVGKISQIAAPSSLGKSFVGLKVSKNAQRLNDEFIVIYIDTEMAFDYKFASSVGLDLERLLVIQSNQIEEVQRQVMEITSEFTVEERSNILLVIDSWGGLVTSKTMENASAGKDVADFTPAKKKNTFAKLLTGLKMTVFVINQVYQTMDQYDPWAIAGGTGLYFASSSIVLGSSKAKSKETASSTEVTGALILATTKKSRFCKELTKLRYLIKYDGGIHPVYGILDDLLEGGFVTKPSMGYYSRAAVPDDKKWREREIWDNWKEFFKPILNDPEVHNYFEKKYTFLHSEISDEDFEGLF
jgi:RecA/RadA recombinase